MRLILIRHGQTPSNVAGVLDTRVPGPGLTERGHEQALILGRELDEPIEAIFASVQVRSQITAAPLAERLGLEVAIREDLREIDCGEFEMRDDTDAIHGYHEALLAWVEGDRAVRMPGAEDGHEVYDRVNRVVAEAEALGLNTVALVAHGALIRSWVGAHAGNIAPGFARENIMPNTGVAILEGSSREGWILESWVGTPLSPGTAGA
ncbi:histidine phosphatase family protein [Mycetocola spongiae]|uniref:histidine phosphatase family protein n=1 Tax=Mycetocola spongiae TaxID=2859226 RepID=UPI001CF4765D|nr:histidine phosphatase family protein [Mycetocola spongiae]UCR87975.1 histidine phosphatase family protein [Mycetocola spongiae]